MYLLVTVAIAIMIQPQHRTKNWTAKISMSGIAMGSVVTWPWLFQMLHF